MNPIKKAATNVKTFVSDHKTAIAIVATATATTAVCIVATKFVKDGYVETVNDFLTEKGLLDEFNFVTFDNDH